MVFLSLTLMAGCGVIVRQTNDTYQRISAGSLTNPGRIGPLTEKEKVWAKVAWRYFVNNTNVQTGLVNSIDRYPAATPWHMGDYLAALTAAYELGLIDKLEFDHRLSRLLAFLGRMELAGGKVPNRVYNTQNGSMVDLSNQVGEAGWSAVDISRLMVWLKIIGERYPEYHEYLDKVVMRWGFCDIIDDCGALFSGIKQEKTLQKRQEGRLGYEDYAGTGYSLWGFSASKTRRLRSVEKVHIEGHILRYDARDPRSSGRPNPLLTPPFVLMGMEFGWRAAGKVSQAWPEDLDIMAEQAQTIYEVQEARWQSKKIFTARGDHQLSRPPYLLYDSIYSNGFPWNTITENGQSQQHLALVSTRSAFGMWVLWKTHYTDELMKVIEALYDSDRGWYEGRYESTGAYEEIITLSTNSMVLEALFYKSSGRIYRNKNRNGYFQTTLDNVYERPKRCFPPERGQCPL
jgi:hypothetical protein